MLSAKYHTIFGDCDQRRVSKLCARAGIQVLSELPSPCPTCAATKSQAPSRRLYERRNVPAKDVQGPRFLPSDQVLRLATEQLAESDALVARMEDPSYQQHLAHEHKIHTHASQLHSFAARATRPGQFFHCDTIPLGNCWNGMREALVMVDDCSRTVYAYAMKNKTGASVADTLRKHFLKLGSTPEGIHYYCHRMHLHSDQGSEFINQDVQALCQEIGATQSYSCPGDLGKWQNSICERKIKDLGGVMRAIMYRSNMPQPAAVYAMYHAVDILNALPTSANITLDNCAGLSPNEVEGATSIDIDSYYAFGSQCFVHLDREHRITSAPHVQAATCVYMCKAHHLGAPGHVVWDYVQRRRLTVPSISQPEWNHYPLRPAGERHLSSRLTWESPPVDQPREATSACPFKQVPEQVDDELAPDLKATIVESDDAAEHAIKNSPQITRYRLMLEGNIGKPIRKVFFVNGSRGDIDYYEGKVHSITANNKYLIIYSDGDSEEMNHKEFVKYRQEVVAQVASLWTDIEAQNRSWMNPKCNCTAASCVHPWGKQHQKDMGSNTGKFRVQEHKSQTYIPSDIPPPPETTDYFAAMTFGHQMPAVKIDWEMSKHAMYDKLMAYAAKNVTGKKSAYEPDPRTIEQCKASQNWQNPIQGNSWWDSILSEVENFRKYGVFDVVDAEQAAGKKVFPSIINFVTKRTKDSTPEREVIDKRKTRICFGGHRCILGQDYTKIDAYAPVPTWGTIKLQLALTALHGLKLKAFDCTAAYLQTEIDKEMYVKPPPGLMTLLGKNNGDIWKLNKAMYGYPRGANLWFQKLFKYLKEYGFRPLGNSATFMMLDRGQAGRIILNVYSDDGLASTSGEEIWREFMTDFKSKFDVQEKAPDYFLGAGIIQHESGAVTLDPSKYLREVASSYDMSKAIHTKLPLPAGSKLYMNQGEEAECSDEQTNLYQQMTGSVMYASLLRPDLMYYASQLGKVMSKPTLEHLKMARQVIQFCNSTAEDVITYRPSGCDDREENDVRLVAFSDSDWACALDTRRSHGSYVIMFAGAAISWRSRSHKSVMLSSAGAEYYEASEACREIAFIRGILMDFYGVDQMSPTPLLIDNQAAIAMGQMPQFTERQKHIPIRICHLKECCAEKLVELLPVSTKNEIADIGTKALGEDAFYRLRAVAMGRVRLTALLASDPNFH